MKKKIALLLVLTMMSGTVVSASTLDSQKVSAADSQDGSAALSGSITFAHHRTDLEPRLNEMVDAFMEEHPDVTVELEIVADYANIMSIRAAGNELPDVFELETDTITPDKWAEYCMPLNESRLYDKVQGQSYYTVDDCVYAFSSSSSYLGFMYNKDLYTEAGITEVPTTWAEFKSAMEKLKALDGVIPITSMYKTSWALSYWINMYANSLRDGGLLNSWVETDTPFSDEMVIKVLDNLKDLADADLMDPDLMSSDWDLQAADFAAGTIGTYLIGSFANETMTSLGMDENSIGFFALPALEKGEKPLIMTTVGRGYCVNKDSENKEEALAFCEFVTENSAKYLGFLSPIIGEECSIPSINEMLAQDATIVSRERVSDDYNGINAIAAINLGAVIQEYLVAEDKGEVIAKYNDIWAAARTEYFN